ncbi:hypothetical protein BCO18442_04004 [Burkholderia contaminans]|nr:hypothetical protein BCO18442_04004 [Burkholderia contaminans]
MNAPFRPVRRHDDCESRFVTTPTPSLPRWLSAHSACLEFARPHRADRRRGLRIASTAARTSVSAVVIYLWVAARHRDDGFFERFVGRVVEAGRSPIRVFGSSVNRNGFPFEIPNGLSLYEINRTDKYHEIPPSTRAGFPKEAAFGSGDRMLRVMPIVRCFFVRGFKRTRQSDLRRARYIEVVTPSTCNQRTATHRLPADTVFPRIELLRCEENGPPIFFNA